MGERIGGAVNDLGTHVLRIVDAAEILADKLVITEVVGNERSVP